MACANGFRDFIQACLFATLLGAQPAATALGDCVANVEFDDRQLLGAIDPPAVVAADFDGDGDLDVVLPSLYSDEVVWRRNLGGQTFSDSQWVTSNAENPYGIFAADINGDGNNDVVVGTETWLRWFDSAEGTPSWGDPHDIDASASRVTSVYAADMDQDGDLDIVAALEGNNHLAWYENKDGSGTTWTKHSFAAGGDGSVVVVDLDDDDDLDVLAADRGYGSFYWVENLDGHAESLSPPRIIDSGSGARSAVAGDLDGDGDLDVVGAASGSGFVAWYRNLGGGDFGGRLAIDDGATNASSVVIVDLDRDGDNDVVASAHVGTNYLAWYENLDGLGTFAPATPISSSTSHYVLSTADVDGDGDDDLLAGTANIGRVYYNELDDCDKNGIDDSCEDPSVAAACIDLDHDGYHQPDDCDDNDPRCATDCTDADGDGWCVDTDCDDSSPYCTTDCTLCEQDCDSDGVPDPVAISVRFDPTGLAGYWDDANVVLAADLDDDGDVDVVAAIEGDEVVHFENVDGLGTFGPLQWIGEGDADEIFSMDAADLDGNGYADVLFADPDRDQVAWYPNDGLGGFAAVRILPVSVEEAWAVEGADIDGDGDTDILVSGLPIKWIENLAGDATSWSPHLIDQAENRWVESIRAADLDGDGDLDVLAAKTADHKVVWYENRDGLGRFGWEQIIDVLDYPGAAIAVDVDGDFDLDVVAGTNFSNFEDATYWYANTDGQGTFAPALTVSDTVFTPLALHAADLDNDGDQDILTGTDYSGLVWSENLDGAGSFAEKRLIPLFYNRHILAVDAADLDGDGDIDVLSARGTSYGPDAVAWHENLRDNCNNNELPDVCEEPNVARECTDVDQDGANMLTDCDDDDTHVWASPGTVSALSFLQTTPPGTTFTWSEPEQPGATILRYDTLRSPDAFDFTSVAVCIDWDSTVRMAADTVTPLPNGIQFYLVRVENDCPGVTSNMGTDSDGVPRPGRVCP